MFDSWELLEPHASRIVKEIEDAVCDVEVMGAKYEMQSINVWTGSVSADLEFSGKSVEMWIDRDYVYVDVDVDGSEMKLELEYGGIHDILTEVLFNMVMINEFLGEEK